MDGEVIFGRNAVTEALKGGRIVKEVYLEKRPDRKDSDEIIRLAKLRGVDFSFRNPIFLKHVALTDDHQGIIAIIDFPKYVSIDNILKYANSKKEQPFVLLLDGIEDPQNFGSIIRSAECAGVHGIIIPKERAVGITPAVVKVSTGASEHMRVVRVEKLSRAIEELKEAGLKIVGTDAEAKTKYYNVPMNCPVGIVIGSEGFGMKKSILDECDVLVSIPIYGKINSLNAAVASAVMVFEASRQRHK